MLDTTIDHLQIEIEAPSTEAATSISKLSDTLNALKTATKNLGLGRVSNQLRDLNAALGSVTSGNIVTLDSLTNSLRSLSTVGKINLNNVTTQLTKLPQAVSALASTDFGSFSTQITQLVTALSPLSAMGKNNLTSFITQLSKIPQLMQNLRSVDMGMLATQIQQLANAFAPLATQMQAISAGFASFPNRIQRLIQNTDNLSRANTYAAKSYINLWAKCRMAMNVVRGIGMTIASWITQSNAYIESLNVFNAALGKFSNEAMKYANQVELVLGIDPGAFLKNWGVFMTIIDGLGVASDRAYIMSKNLTQLSYDINSFYGEAMGVTLEDAMQKLTSGISGELEPLRRLGYDLSQARLQAIALSLGIDKTFTSMSQAEKAQLRYYAIMTQVTVAQGDFARTLTAPANQLRVLKAQVAQVARALGNIFIPVLNFTLPYLIAFAKILRMVINLIGKFVGFELPDVDYSGISAGSDAMGDLTDSENDATKAAKKLKNALLGIDELNVLSKNEDSSGNSSGNGLVGGGDLGFELPEYNFLDSAINKQVDELVKKFKEWAGLTDDIDTWAEFFHTKLGRILILVGEIAAGFLAWKFAKVFLNALAWLQNLKNLGLTTPLTLAAGIVLSLTGLTIEWTGLNSIIKDGIDKLNLSETVGGAIMTTIGGSFIGKAASGLLAKAGITSTAIANGVGASLAGALFGGGIAAVVAGIPAFVVGIYSSIKEGLSGLSVFLTEFGATLTGAGAGAIGAALGAWGGPIGIGIGALIGVVVGALTNLGIYMYQNWEEIKAWAVGVKKSVQAWFSDRVTDIKNFPENAKQAMMKLPQKLKEGLAKTSQWLDSLPDKIKKRFDDWGNSIGKWFDNLWQSVRDFDWSSLGKKMGEGVGKAWNFVTKKLPEIWNEIKAWFKKLFSDDIPYFFTEFIPKLWETIKEWVLTLPDKFEKIKTSIKEGFVNIGKQCLDGLIEGVSAIGDAWKKWKDGFVQGFKDALGIHSPSTVFKELGGYIVDGLLGGINGKIADCIAVVKEWAGGVVEWFTKGKDGKGIVENFKETAGNIINGFKDKVGSTYTTVKTNITTWASNVKEWFSNSSFGGINRETFSAFANNTIEGFKTKVSSAYTNVKSTITTWASSVKEWFTSSSFGGVNSSSFQTFANNTIEGFKSKISNAYTNTKSSITTWASNVKTWFTDNGYGGINNTNWQTFANNVIEGFRTKVSSAYTNTKSAVTTWASNVKSWFSDIASNSAFAGFATSVIDGFKSKVGSYYSTAQSVMTSFANSVKGWFEKPNGSSLVSSFINIGKNIIQGFIDGVSSLWDKAMDIIKDFGKSIISSGKKGTEERSPSRAFKEIGAFVIEGFNIGIRDTMGSSFRLMSEWTNGITSYAPTVGFAVDTASLKYLDSASFTKSLSANVSTVSRYAVESSFSQEEMRDAVLQALNDSNLAGDMRRQADKKEQTIVQVGNRTITDTVTTQQNANGFRFVTV